MKHLGQINKRHLALICLVLVLAYTAIVLIPHAHECGGVNCEDCAILQSWRNALGVLTLSAMLCGLVGIVWRIVPTHTYILEARTGTPVGRKVKLSD